MFLSIVFFSKEMGLLFRVAGALAGISMGGASIIILSYLFIRILY
jgi:hypothetical protein